MIKSIQKWLVPAGIAEVIRQKRVDKVMSQVLFPENAGFRNRHSDVKRCFILATGPSIREEDLSVLQGEFCISVSNFFVHDLYASLQPHYHVFAASHPPITKQQYGEWLKDAADKTNFRTTFVVSSMDKDVIDGSQQLRNLKPLYYTPGGKFPVDFEKRIPPFRTVVHIAIYLAMYIGIKEIYLLGADHSWAMHYGESRHFYPEKEHKLTQLNYNEWRHDDIGKLFEGYGKTWTLYRNIREEASRNGIQITNLTQNSVLDIFPRGSLKEVAGVKS